MGTRSLWITVCLFNLSIVALLGFGLRSKIVFSLPEIDYKNLLSAHSHFAFSGWAGLSLFTLMIYDLLPSEFSAKKIYNIILAGVQVSSLGMLCSFPFYGYNIISIFFSTLYIIVTIAFIIVFLKHSKLFALPNTVRIISISALVSSLLSFIGIGGLVYILASKTGNSILYRDSIYTFLHFQYNGFFTLAIFALFLNYLYRSGVNISGNARKFVIYLCLSVIPSLFLSLLWHNSVLYYIIGGIGCILMLMSLCYFLLFLKSFNVFKVYGSKAANLLLLFAIISFILKITLNIGTIIPSLGNAVFGDRPIIIGFLHLVFLGFLTFYLLSTFINDQYFTVNNKFIALPVVVFSIGIFLNEILLMVQGLGVLFNTNSQLFQWLLWIAAIILFIGAILMFLTKLRSYNEKRT